MSKESAIKIRSLRTDSKIGDQGAFAKALRVAQSLVSACEGGKNPSTAMLLKLGIFGSQKGLYSEAVWFFRQADPQLLEAILPVTRQASKERIRSPRRGEIVSVPASQKIPGKSNEAELPFPAWMIPSPLTRYVRLTDDFKQPLFRSGDLLLIDEANADLRKLEGLCVAFYRPPSEREYVRLTDRPERLPQLRRLDGVFAAWLLKHFDSPEFESTGEDGLFTVVIPNRLGHPLQHPIDLRGGDLVILGRVIAWIPKHRQKRTRRQEKRK